MTSAGRRVGVAAVLGICAAIGAFGACGPPDDRPPPPRQATLTGSGAGGGDLLPPDDGGPPPLDADGLCGNQQHEAISDAPNVYFVIDASGSMAAPVPGTSDTRYERVRDAAIDLVVDLGALIRVGVALFPHGATPAKPCAVGAQVMAVAQGDPYTGSPKDGPTTTAFKKATKVDVFGGTPTAPTLTKLHPGLKALPGKTFVVLITDGGPNCNADLACDASECQVNLEGCTQWTCCDPGKNCCAPGGVSGPEGCLDRQASLDAVQAYADSGIPVYVVGIPGSEAYSDLLEDMAFAAGTAQIAEPFYYAVDKLDDLGNVLGSIASVAVSCVFHIDDPPEVPDHTNVYLDGVVLPADLQNGWRWMDPELSRIELLGESCKRLKAGQIKLVQIVSGCPTEPPK